MPAGPFRGRGAVARLVAELRAHDLLLSGAGGPR
jgi:hypothetical protein